MKKKLLSKVCLVLCIITFTTLSAHAQPPDPPQDGDAPLDGGIIALTLIGSALGGKQLLARRK